MTNYSQTVATLIDAGVSNSALARLFLRRRKYGMTIPETALYIAERFDILLAQAPDEAARDLYRAQFDAEDIDWFDEPPTRRVMRRFLQSRRHGLAPGEIEAFIAEHGGAGGVLRMFKGLVGDAGKRETLRALMASEPGIDWSRYREIVAFVTPKIDRSPEPDLIRDWLDGLVTFEGDGVVRAQMREDENA